MRKRFLIIFLAFLGNINLYTLRISLSVAIVALTKNRTITDENGNERNEPIFDWSSQQIGFALGAFFYGYIVTQIISGLLAKKFGGHLVIKNSTIKMISC